VPVTWITRAATGVGGFRAWAKCITPSFARSDSMDAMGRAQGSRDRLGAMGNRLGVLSF
jgi:hypothetical protein